MEKNLYSKGKQHCKKYFARYGRRTKNNSYEESCSFKQ